MQRQRKKIQYPVSRAFAHRLDGLTDSRPAVAPVQRTGLEKPRVDARPGDKPIQRYEDMDEYKVSNTRKFAVKNEGKPDSEMFIDPKEITLPGNLKRVKFKPGEATGPFGLTKLDYELDEHMKTDVEDMHCNTFSREVTGISEEVENETAPPGRSLFMDDMHWGRKRSTLKNDKRGNWGSHYAPVIAEDNGDRGTFETAVGVKHAWYGIYGQEKGHTFRLKTVIADINLAFDNEKISEKEKINLLDAVDRYVKEDKIEGTDDEMIKELEKIDSIRGDNPDLDREEKRRQQEKLEKENEVSEYYQMFLDNNPEQLMVKLKEIGLNAVPNKVFVPLREKAQLETNEGNRVTVLGKITECEKIIAQIKLKDQQDEDFDFFMSEVMTMNAADLMEIYSNKPTSYIRLHILERAKAGAGGDTGLLKKLTECEIVCEERDNKEKQQYESLLSVLTTKTADEVWGSLLGIPNPVKRIMLEKAQLDLGNDEEAQLKIKTCLEKVLKFLGK